MAAICRVKKSNFTPPASLRGGEFPDLRSRIFFTWCISTSFEVSQIAQTLNRLDLVNLAFHTCSRARSGSWWTTVPFVIFSLLRSEVRRSDTLFFSFPWEISHPRSFPNLVYVWRREGILNFRANVSPHDSERSHTMCRTFERLSTKL